MARFRYGTGKFDHKAKTLMNADVVVYAGSLLKARNKVLKLIGRVDDIYLKEIEETPDEYDN